MHGGIVQTKSERAPHHGARSSSFYMFFSLYQLFRPAVAEVPVNVYHQVEVFGEVELVFQHLAEVFLVDVVQPVANADVEAVGLLVEEDTATRNHGVVVFREEDGLLVALGHGAVVLLLPVGLVQFANGGMAVNKLSLLGIYLLHAEE